jgi:hypothetical protein
MNFETLNLGTVANDHTGDTLRSGGFKINRNFHELFWTSPQRHRQSPLVYRQTNNNPDYLTANSVSGGSWLTLVSVSLSAPFVGAIGAGNDERGERNYSAIVTTDQTPAAWGFTHNGGVVGRQNYVHFLWIERNYIDLTVDYGYSLLAPEMTSDTAPSSPATDQHWWDRLNGIMKRWNGSSWEETPRLFIGVFLYSGPGPGDSLGDIGTWSFSYTWSNDELAEMKRQAIIHAIVFGGGGI